MEQGIVVLVIIALLFTGMYVYAYSSVYFEKLKLKKAYKQELELASLRLEEKARKQEIRNEKILEMDARREERQQQFSRLTELRQELIRKGKIETEKGLV